MNNGQDNVQEGSQLLAGEEMEDTSLTTLMLRLPPHMGQDMLQKWLDMWAGHRKLYDFLIWFPGPMQTVVDATNMPNIHPGGFAYVNFRNSADAQRFRREHHQKQVPKALGDPVLWSADVGSIRQ